MAQVAGEAYSIGDIGPAGGVVFITPSTSGNTTGYYFEVAPSLSSASRTWAQSTPTNYQTTAVTGADATAIGTGYQNTLDIVAQGNSTSTTSAAAYCRSLTINDYNDWFLPSKDELNQIYLNTTIVGYAGFSNAWSSSEAISSQAFLLLFSGGTQNSTTKAGNYSAIPVRMFSAPRTKYPETSDIVKYGSPTVVQRLGNDSVYGNGADGIVTISANTTLTTDMYYDTLTINSGVILNTNGFRVFVKNTLTLNGYIGIGTGAGAETASAVSNGTLKGTGSETAVTYSIGGYGGGATTTTVATLPSAYLQVVESIVLGGVVASDGTFNAITGGAGGTTGSTGATTTAYTNSDSWTGKAGAIGSDGSWGPSATSENSPGGRGVTASPGNATGATPGPGGAGGAGARGGGVVLVVAKNVAGNGKIISRGMSGATGSAGTSGSGGTQGANGAQAPTYHNPNPPGSAVSHAPHTGHPAYDSGHGSPDSYAHHHYVGYDIHSHSNNVAPHNSRNHYGHTVPTQTGHNHHYYNNGSRHPVNSGTNPATGYTQYHGNIYGHYTYSHYNGSIHGNNATYRSYQPHYVHAGTGNSQRWTHTPANHHAVAHPYTHPTPATPYAGGAGGVNNGVNTGKAAPAVTGATGKRGGAGGGGGIILITESTPSSISYDTLAGQTADADTNAAFAGYSYVILNK